MKTILRPLKRAGKTTSHATKTATKKTAQQGAGAISTASTSLPQDVERTLARVAAQTGSTSSSESLPSNESSPQGEENFLSAIRKGALFWEFQGPQEIKEPSIDDAYAKTLAERAHLLFERPFDAHEEVEKHYFYEDVEQDFFEATYGKVSPMGDHLIQSMDCFRRTAIHNDGMIALRLPTIFATIFLLASLAVGFLPQIPALSDIFAPLANPMTSLAVQGIIGALLLIAYLLFFVVPYTNSQRLTVNRFDNYLLTITNFSRTQFTELKSKFQKVDTDTGIAPDQLNELARHYSVAIQWVIFSAFLLRGTIRSTLFHHRRELAFYRVGGIGLLLLFGMVAAAAIFLLPLTASLSAFPLGNGLLLGG
ncbi:MAG: hypothetical protein AAGJ31_15560 [Verrucomicrobiota bacterium]